MNRRNTNTHPVVIIGAGVVGASIAHQLARQGRKVTVLDGGRVAGGVTASSFAWVGVAKSSAHTYADALRASAQTEFDRVLSELSDPVGLRRHGAIVWESSVEATREFVREHQDAGHRIKLLTSQEVSKREPSLRVVPVVAAFAPDDLGVDPIAYTRALLHSAKSHGAEVREHTKVLALLTDSGRVRGVTTDRGEIIADTVVLAAGTASASVAETAGAEIELHASPCCLLTFSTSRPLAYGILSAPEFEIRQLDDTTLLAAEDVPSGFCGDAAELAAATIDALRTHIDGLEAAVLHLERAVIANRPIPAVGEPLVEPASGVPGLYLAVAHPAVILSAAIGRKVAADIGDR